MWRFDSTPLAMTREPPTYPEGIKSFREYPNGIKLFSPALAMKSPTLGNGMDDAINPERVVWFAWVRRARVMQPRWGWKLFGTMTQGSSFLATLGWMIQSLWDLSRAFRLVINLLRHAQGKMTAAATTGPANGPRPASSTPATSVNPRDQRSRSNSRRSKILTNIW